MAFKLIVVLAVFQAVTTIVVGTTDQNERRCGRPVPRNNTKFVEYLNGGKPVFNLPWMVSIQFDNYHVCGGTIIAPQWILTAAHCSHELNGFSESVVKLVVGVDSLMIPSTSPYRREIHKTEFRLIPHPRHRTPDQFSNDVMLIWLKKPLNYTDGVLPVCLPTADDMKRTPRNCSVSGWGAANFTQCQPLWKGEFNEERSPNQLPRRKVDLLSCMEECYTKRETCHAINFDYIHRTCSFVMVADATSHEKFGSVVYHLNRNCADCAACTDIWAEFDGYKFNGHVTQQHDNNKPIECRLACSRDETCSGIDYSESNADGTRCFFSPTIDPKMFRLQRSANFKHYQLIRGFRELANAFRQELRQANMPLLAARECKTLFNGNMGVFHMIDENITFCAGYRDGRRNTCQGDSGGPLVCVDPRTDTYTQYGVVNGGPDDERQQNQVTLFTNVSGHLEWINRVMNNPGEAYAESEQTCLTAIKTGTSCIFAEENPCGLLPNGNYQACERCTVYHSCNDGMLVTNDCDPRKTNRFLEWDSFKGRCVEGSKSCQECNYP